MLNFIQGVSFMGFIIGVASIAGAVELDRSPVAAIILSIISIIFLYMIEDIKERKGKRRNGKNNYRFY